MILAKLEACSLQRLASLADHVGMYVQVLVTCIYPCVDMVLYH